MLQKPDLTVANPEILREIVTEIYRRAKAVAPEIADVVLEEVRKCFDDWSGRTLEDYYPTAKRNANRSLLQGAEQAAKKRAIGLLPGYAWPIMNSMRSVEPDTPFRMKDKRTRSGEAKTMTDDSGEASNQIEIPPWRS
jgi:hypothetical protein